jgi:hypothetical protein
VARRAEQRQAGGLVGKKPVSLNCAIFPAAENRAVQADGFFFDGFFPAIREYFAPLQKWLDEQNEGKPAGWSAQATGAVGASSLPAR